MSMAATLTELFPTLPLTAPHRAQLDRLGYVADDMSAVRERLLARLAESFPQWNPALTDNVGNPDFGVLFVDLFTHLSAILNAYSDVRMNESFLRTAQLERSLIDLAALVDYRLAPGSSAAGLQAFIAKDGMSGSLPANFKVQAPAAGSTPTVVFETQSALEVQSVRNQLRLHGYDRSSRVLLLRTSASATQDQSALLDSRYRSLKAGVPVIFDGGTFRETLPLNASSEIDGKTRITWPAGLASADRDAPIADLTLHGRPELAMRLAESARADELTLGSVDVPVNAAGNFSVGDVVLLKSDGVQMAARVLARVSGTGILTLSKPLIASLRRSATTVTRAVQIGRVSNRIRPGATTLINAAGSFGGNTPQAGDYLLLGDDVGVEIANVAHVDGNTIVLSSPVMRAMRPSRAYDSGGGFSIFGTAGVYLFRVRAVNPPNSSPVRALRVSDLAGIYQSGTTVLDLDKTYDDLTENSLVAASDGTLHQSYTIKSAETIDGKTRLVLNGTLASTLRVAPLQLFAGFEYAMRVDGYNQSESLIPAGTSQLQLIGTGLGLAAGSCLILDDGSTTAAPVGARLTQVAESEGLTQVSLARPLERSLVLADTIVYGNVAPVSHGASVAEEILGSGDPAVVNQRFTLRRSPLSFTPDATQARGVAANLEVFVGDKRWTEVATLADSAATDEHYALEIDDEQAATISFGDGVHGAAPASGRNNIRARYRIGLGAAGNVAEGRLKQMPQALPFVTSTLNPASMGGGAERETPQSAKRAINLRVHTLDRAVSLADYADLALTFSGVAKARADYSREESTGAKTVLLTVVASGGAALGIESKDALYAFFRLRAPPRPALVIRDARRIAVRVSLQVTVLPDFLLVDVEKRVWDALGDTAFFSFDRRDLGEDLYLSELYAAVESVSGVDHVLATAFHPESAAPAVLDRVAVDADAWPSGGDPVDASIGRLAISFSGGVS
jgi:hypothetical protein